MNPAFGLSRTVKALMEAANNELKTFSYSVSHDLRAPLQVINGFSHALHEDYADKLDEEGKHLLERIEASTLRMARIIEDLLKLSHLNQAAHNPGAVDMSSMAREIFNQLRDASPARSVDIEIQPGMTPRCDAGLMKIALENQLGNAWKYSAKIPQAHIRFGCSKQNRQDVYFIRDDGAGFDMNYAKQLFGPFQRMHHKDEFEGNGIGLATVKAIIALSSAGAVRAVPAYTAIGSSKGALEALARHLAVELAPRGIRVNILSPGSVATHAWDAFPDKEQRLADALRRSPLGRLVTVEEVALAAQFLCSPAATAIVGHTLVIDGGTRIVE